MFSLQSTMKALLLTSLLTLTSSIHHTQRLRSDNPSSSLCNRDPNLLFLDMTLAMTFLETKEDDNDNSNSIDDAAAAAPTSDDDEEVDPCAEAREEMRLVYDTREEASNVTLIDNRLTQLTKDETLEQQTEAHDMELNQKQFVTAKSEYDGEASILHSEMQVVASCSEAAHLALFHAFESRQRGDPVDSQSILLKLATDRVECAEKKLVEIMPLRQKILKLRFTYKTAQKKADTSEQRVRALIKHQFMFAKKACLDLTTQASQAHIKLLSILATTKSDAKLAASTFKQTNVMDDKLMMAIQKGNVASARGKVFHEAIVARQKTTCAREKRLKSELGSTADEMEASAADPYENVNHGEATHYPEVDRLRNELNGVLAIYSQARNNANLAEASFGSVGTEKKSGASGPAEGASGPAK